MREFGKENNASASAAGGLRDYDKHSVVSNTMQKVSFVLYSAQVLAVTCRDEYTLGTLQKGTW